MASFVESATLKVNDQSTAQINKINAALKQLFNTAKSLKSTTINLRVNAQGLTKAAADARALSAALRGLRSTNIHIGVNAQGITQAQRQIAQLRAQTQRPINVATQAGGGGARGGGGGGRPSSATHGAARGFARGLGVSGMADLIGSYGAVAGAGYAAAAALRAVAASAATRDRTNLQAAIAATEAQRKIFAEQDAARAALPKEQRPELPFTDDERKRLRTSLLGEVSAQVQERTGMDPLDPRLTPEQRIDAQQRRAMAAGKITDYLERAIAPVLYALNPDKDRAQTIEGLKQIVKAVNLGSTDMIDAQGNISKDAQRVFKGVAIAQYAEPELQPGEIKTALANLKGAAYSLSPEALAGVLINASARGQRAANEAYRAQKVALGTADVKKVNDMLADAGLLEGVTRKKGHVVPGSGRPIDQTTLLENPAKWYQDHFVPAMNAQLKKEADARAKAMPARTEEERAAKAKAAEITNADQRAYIERKLAGASQAAIQGITDLILGNQQTRETLAQASDAAAQPIGPALQQSWTAALENLKTSATNAFAGVGDNIAKQLNLAPILQGLADQINQHPILATFATVAGAVGTLGFAATGAAGALRALSVAAIVPGAAGAAGAAAGVVGGGAAAAFLRAIPVIGTAAALLATIMPQPAGEDDKTGVQALLKQQTDTLRAQTAVEQAIKDLKAAPPGTPEQQTQVKAVISQLEAQLAALGEKAKTLTQQIEQATGDKAKTPEQAAADKAAADAEAARVKAAADEKSRVDAEVARVKAEQQDTATKAFIDAVNKMEAEKKAAADAAAAKKKEEEAAKPKPAEEEAAKPKPTEPVVLPEVKIEPIKLDTTQLESLTFPGLTTTAETIKGAATTLESASSQYVSLMAKTSDDLTQAGSTFAEPMSAAATAITTAAPQISSSFTQAAASMTAIGPQIAAPFTAAAGTLASTSATFAGVFQTGAAAIASSGQQAASALQAGAPAAGAALGAAAVAAIRAGVSGLTINVNANVVGGTASKGDPGASKGD
jgi:hypothetical protein